MKNIFHNISFFQDCQPHKVKVNNFEITRTGKIEQLLFIAILFFFIFTIVSTPIIAAGNLIYFNPFIWNGLSAGALLIVAVLIVILEIKNKSISIFLKINPVKKIVVLIGAYALISLLYWLPSEDYLAATVGLFFNLRFLVFFIFCMVLANISEVCSKKTFNILIKVAVFVSFLAIIQYFIIPPDGLTAIGYRDISNNEQGLPLASIRLADTEIIRPQSTLRGPNELGNYLVIFLGFFVLGLVNSRASNSSIKVYYSLGLAVMLFAMILSRSRSALIAGGIVLIGLATWLIVNTRKIKIASILLISFLILSLCALLIIFTPVIETDFFRREVLHSNTSKLHIENADQARARSLQRALENIASRPLGYGIGSAGVASTISNSTNITENYFLQVAQETGVICFVLFLLINVCLFRVLIVMSKKDSSYVSLVYLLSFIGLSFSNLFLPVWSFEAVAIVWWGLAGMHIWNNRLLLV